MKDKISPNILLKEKGAANSNTYSEPHNIDAEQLVLGAILTNNQALNEIGDFLKAEHFYEPVHQKIYKHAVDFFDKGVIATPITLKNFFHDDKDIDELGGNSYLSNLAAQAAAVINVKDYASIIYDLALKRELIHLGGEIIHNASDRKSEKSAITQLESAEQKLFNMASDGQVESDFKKISISLNQALETAQKSVNADGFSGIPTELTDLDKLLGGIQNSDLIILAGRPSMGKTALAINMALNACEAMYETDKEEEKRSVGFFSLEMSAEQLASRMISMKSGVNAKKFRSGNLTNDDFSAIIEANKHLHKLPFFIDDTPALSISALRTRARRLKRKSNLGLLVVDYLQLVRGSGGYGDNRVQEVSQITQGLKAIAKELNIPVIALSQLSRAVEQREDKKPQLSDLRESGSIEQDADIVMFIFREQYYVERLKPRDDDAKKMSEWQVLMDKVLNKAEVIVAKQRHGPIGNVSIYFNADTTKFGNLASNN